MAKVQIYGDTNKGCIFFDGSTVEPKFLGTIIATVKADETEESPRAVSVSSSELQS